MGFIMIHLAKHQITLADISDIRVQIVIISKALVIIIDGEAKFDHAVDAASELSGLIQVEARCQERGVEEQPDQILHCLVGLVCSRLLPQLLNLSTKNCFRTASNSHLGSVSFSFFPVWGNMASYEHSISSN